nr:four-carbon acid sugar kinase family protein [Amaricoccus macauensis]
MPTATPVLAFYGDDFTGSGAVLEVLSFAGLPTVLFLAPPTPADLARFPEARAIGLAGDARTWSPDRMRTELPAICASLRALGAPILHYKLCSTLDSAPGIGSIGTAAEVALAPGALAPLVVAAPEIGRWQAFGTLFARAGDGGIHRLDRHPTMSVHPVTAMDEADVLRHIARQTSLPLALADLNDLKSGRGLHRLTEAQRTGGILAIDVVDAETLAAAGDILWQAQGFVLGSQGVEYALVAAWRRAGLLPPAPTPERLAPTGRIAVVSGSCSPTTAAQIDAAEAAGFAVIDLCPGEPDWDAATRAALTALADGRSPLVATSRGQNDTGADPGLGAGLGRLLDRLIRETGITRSVIAGGDTSSAAARALGLTALTAETPIAPGAPLLRGHRAEGPGIELVMKGGQMGPTDFFVHVRDGLPPTAGAAGRMRRNA